MTEKDLWLYRDTLERMYAAAERLREYENILSSPMAPKLGEIRGNTYDSDRMSPAVSYLDKLRAEKERTEAEHIKAREIMDRVCDMLPHTTERQVVDLRYKQAWEWEDIAITMRIARASVYRIRRRILDDISGIDIDKLA